MEPEQKYNSSPEPDLGGISKLFQIRLNELLAEGDLSTYLFAEGLLDAKGLSLPKGEDVEKRSSLRILNGERVMVRAVVRVKHGLDDENGKMPRPDDLKDLEAFRKYFYNLLADVVESMVPKEPLEMIKADARLVIKELRPISFVGFGLNRESVAWLESYIEHLRKSGAFEDKVTKSKVAILFGSFLGQCIIECYGGNWEKHDGERCVAFDSNNAVFPFAKVTKQMENGLEEGVASFFKTIPVVFAGHVKKVSKFA
jgi:hypothetical protein